jgi:hypothetical protein
MATCTDNSTECLLQKVVAALDQANSGYNWNPVTFAVTVVIGVIALWLALLPVLQGILYPPDLPMAASMSGELESEVRFRAIPEP